MSFTLLHSAFTAVYCAALDLLTALVFGLYHIIWTRALLYPNEYTKRFVQILYPGANDCYTVGMSPSSTREQTSSMTQQASDFLIEAQRVLDSLALLLESPGKGTDHSYVEMVRLTAQARETSRIYAEQLALTARQRPSEISLRRLATALGVSVNTLQRRLSALDRPYEDPFATTQGGDQ